MNPLTHGMHSEFCRSHLFKRPSLFSRLSARTFSILQTFGRVIILTLIFLFQAGVRGIQFVEIFSTAETRAHQASEKRDFKTGKFGKRLPSGSKEGKTTICSLTYYTTLTNADIGNANGTNLIFQSWIDLHQSQIR